MAKKDKQVDAEITKEDAEVMTTQDEGAIPNEDENDGPGGVDTPEANMSKDKEINAVGADVETVERPKAEPPKVVTFDELLEADPEMAVNKLRGAVVYLVKSLMTPADLEDFKKLFPGLV